MSFYRCPNIYCPCNNGGDMHEKKPMTWAALADAIRQMSADERQQNVMLRTADGFFLADLYRFSYPDAARDAYIGIA